MKKQAGRCIFDYARYLIIFSNFYREASFLRLVHNPGAKGKLCCLYSFYKNKKRVKIFFSILRCSH
jgi:hypothetical protein